jgi:hypothetical protein
MIAHVSIASADPRSTTLLLAALIDGTAFPFPVVPGAWIAVANDESGLAVEVYPDGMAHHPGTGEVNPGLVPAGPAAMPWEDQIFADGDQLRPSAFHFALTTRLADEEVLALAREHGLRAVPCDRAGVFRLIELWLDGSTLVEVLNAHEAGRYRQFMRPSGCAAMFGEGIAPRLAA